MILESIVCGSASLALYHHVGYPLALRAFTRTRTAAPQAGTLSKRDLPSIAMIIPAFNEERYIAEKIANCARLDYGEGAIEIIVVCDGCSDTTVERAAGAIAALGDASSPFRLVVNTSNRGKVATLNQAIAACSADLVALTDVSARLPTDALTRAADVFADPNVGFITGIYSIPGGGPSQQAYWRYQTNIKRLESALGSPIGAHGAFYVFRHAAWTGLEPDTINDDVILPMRIVERGFRGAYEQEIAVVETDIDPPARDFARRKRLGAGAMQQASRLWRLADPRRPGIAFAFLSGKALRALMPFLMATALLASLALSVSSPVFAAIFGAQLAVYCLAAVALASPRVARLPGLAPLSYLVVGHAMSGLGAVSYLSGGFRRPWARAADETGDSQRRRSGSGSVVAGKRALDIVVASLVLVVLAVIFIPVAVAIKLESRGPVFYRQLRVGLRTSKKSRLFHLTKFRTMRADAEAQTGAVWATDRDPRITRMGYFLRKTRLDELPQCIDVLRGDMSVVGPRPERPQFFNRLENEIPFYAERTYGLKPGITGLAQVYLPYDASIEDVRLKVLHDHAYALRILAAGRWLSTDLGIIFRTFAVMVLGKGR